MSFAWWIRKEDSDFLQSLSLWDPSLLLISIQLLPASLSWWHSRAKALWYVCFGFINAIQSLISSLVPDCGKPGDRKLNCSEAFQCLISLQTHIKFAILFEVSGKEPWLTSPEYLGSVFLTTLLLVWYSSPCGRWEWDVAEVVSQGLGILRARIIHPLTSLASPFSVLFNLYHYYHCYCGLGLCWITSKHTNGRMEVTVEHERGEAIKHFACPGVAMCSQGTWIFLWI